jgi:hypothetical protein
LLTVALVLLACIIVLVVLASVLGRRPAHGAILLGGLLVAPVFLRFTGRSLTLGDPVSPFGYSTGQTFPLSVAAIALALGVLLLHRGDGGRWRQSPLAAPIIAFACLNFAILVLGLVHERHVEDVLFFGQTIGPMLAFFVAMAAVRYPQTALRIVRASALTMGWVVALLFGYTILLDGLRGLFRLGISTWLVVLPIYAAYDYFPLVIAVAYGLALALVLAPRGARVRPSDASRLRLLAVAMFASLFFLHSKNAFITAAAITVLQFVGVAAEPARRRRVFAAAVACAAVVLVFAVGPRTSTIRSFEVLGAERSADPSVRSRVQDFSASVREVFAHPLTGMRYEANSVDVRGIRHIGANPHDQYLTYGTRGGVLSLALFVWILGAFLVRMNWMRQHPASPVAWTLATALLTVFAAVALISNFFQDNFIQPYSACFLWFMMGVGESAFTSNMRTLRRRSRLHRSAAPPAAA